MRVSAAGNMPLQGLVKPPAKPVVMILSRFELRVELENGGDGFLMHLFHGGEQRRIGQRLSTTHGFGPVSYTHLTLPTN